MDELFHQLKLFTIDNLGGGSFSPRDIPNFIFGLLLTALLAWLLGQVYVRYGHALSNRKTFSRNFLLIAVTTMIIITVVKSSLALSLGLVGALSIVRFRSAIKEPEELAYLFITIAIGLGNGAGFTVLTVTGFFFLCILIWFNHKYVRPYDNQNMFITVSFPEGGNSKLPDIGNILKKYAVQVKLKRADESATSAEASFLVEFETLDAIEKSKEELKKLHPSVSVTYMDNTRDF